MCPWIFACVTVRVGVFQGCYEAIKDYLLKYQNAAIGVGVAILIIEVKKQT